jgi:hypothetical protein
MNRGSSCVSLILVKENRDLKSLDTVPLIRTHDAKYIKEAFILYKNRTRTIVEKNVNFVGVNVGLIKRIL